MRVGELTVEEVDRDLVRSVRLAWVGGETRLWMRAPARYAVPDDDLSPFVPVALLLAMRRSEPLAFHGPVSPLLMSRLPLAQQLLSAWDPSLTRVPVRAERELAPSARGLGHACGFSRGVDSTYSVIAPRPPGEELTHLVFCMHWYPGWSSAAEDAVRDAAGRAAAAVGRELVVVATNVREPLWGLLDWNDAHGAALAMLGLSLPGAAGRFTIASNVDHGNFLPRGSHPQLDPLWSTERVAVVHDDAELDRAGKLARIVRDRPELLEHLHVCLTDERADNCGECPKCLLTMACLQAAGGSGLPSAFPNEFDLDAIRKLEFPPLVVRMGFNAAYAALPPQPEDAPLRDALAEMLRRSSRADWDEGDQCIYAHQERLMRAIWSGRPHVARANGPQPPPAAFGELDPQWPPPAGGGRQPDRAHRYGRRGRAAARLRSGSGAARALHRRARGARQGAPAGRGRAVPARPARRARRGSGRWPWSARRSSVGARADTVVRPRRAAPARALSRPPVARRASRRARKAAARRERRGRRVAPRGQRRWPHPSLRRSSSRPRRCAAHHGRRRGRGAQIPRPAPARLSGGGGTGERPDRDKPASASVDGAVGKGPLRRRHEPA